MDSAVLLAPPVSITLSRQHGAGVELDVITERAVESEPIPATPTVSLDATLADAVLRALTPDKWYAPVRAAFFLSCEGVSEAAAALDAALAAGWLDVESGTKSVGYDGRCYLPGRLLPTNDSAVPAPTQEEPAPNLPPPAIPPDSPVQALALPAPVFSYYKGPIWNKTPRASITVAQLHAMLTDPSQRLRALAESARAAYVSHGRGKEYDALKSQLDYVTVAGTFTHRATDGLLVRSGLMVLDFDNLRDVAAARTLLLADPLLGPEIVSLFVSPSGDGLKAIVSAGTENAHQEAFTVLKNYLARVYGPDLTPDKKGGDVPRACFVGYDPDAWLHPAYALPIA